MESNTCYLSLPLVEAARVVSKVVEDAGMSSKMAACHELRWGDDLYGLVMIFEKYYMRAGSRVSMTVVLDALEDRTRLYWAVTGGNGVFRPSGESRSAAGEHSEALRKALYEYITL